MKGNCINYAIVHIFLFKFMKQTELRLSKLDFQDLSKVYRDQASLGKYILKLYFKLRIKESTGAIMHKKCTNYIGLPKKLVINGELRKSSAA